ncbi:MAG: hypothetical protein U9R03_04455 [Candidatus Aerophobetes bacterium]|nr:hypothetical protein [Candidatus Aerophobetes bacterium]
MSKINDNIDDINDIDSKQDTLVSGINVKTVGGTSILGGGNIEISNGSVNSLNDLDITATSTELNNLDGFTGTVTDLNYTKDLRTTGVTTTEFDYLDGVTSNIQTQLNSKISNIYAGNLVDVSGSTISVDLSEAGIETTLLDTDYIMCLDDAVPGKITLDNFKSLLPTGGLSDGDTIDMSGDAGIVFSGTAGVTDTDIIIKDGVELMILDMNDNAKGKLTVITKDHYAIDALVLSPTSSNMSFGVRGSGAGTSPGPLVGVIGSGIDYDFYADGDGANYGPFTGAHDCMVSRDENYTIGDIIITKGVPYRTSVSNVLVEGVLAVSLKDKNVYGVVSSIIGDVNPRDISAIKLTEGIDEYGRIQEEYTEEELLLKEELSGYIRLAVNALGEGQVNVCEANGDINSGDYICSSNVSGKGQKQDDDILHSYTIAKSLEDVIWVNEVPGENGCFEFEGVKCKMIGCTYHCG